MPDTPSWIRHPILFVLMLVLLIYGMVMLLIPQQQVPFQFKTDWLNHAFLFFSLTLGCKLALKITLGWLTLGLFALASFSELSQFLVSYRHFSLDDLGANFLGVSCAVIFCGLFYLAKIEAKA